MATFRRVASRSVVMPAGRIDPGSLVAGAGQSIDVLGLPLGSIPAPPFRTSGRPSPDRLDEAHLRLGAATAPAADFRGVGPGLGEPSRRSRARGAEGREARREDFGNIGSPFRESKRRAELPAARFAYTVEVPSCGQGDTPGRISFSLEGTSPPLRLPGLRALRPDSPPARLARVGGRRPYRQDGRGRRGGGPGSGDRGRRRSRPGS